MVNRDWTWRIDIQDAHRVSLPITAIEVIAGWLEALSTDGSYPSTVREHAE